jgi:hypothetical protein
MENKVSITIPENMANLLFYGQNTTVELDASRYHDWNDEFQYSKFPYELLFYSNIDAYRPWLYDEIIPRIFKEWEVIKSRLEGFFSERKKDQSKELMVQGIAQCLCAMFWQNQQPVELKDWESVSESFTYKPVNWQERMNFIMTRPNLYHSFIQLNELMEELKKIYYKQQVLKKRK